MSKKLADEMDDSMAHTEHWDSCSTFKWKELPESCNDQDELYQELNNPQPDVEAGETAAAYTARKRRGRKPKQTPDEKRKKKNANDKNYWKDRKAKFDRLMKIASDCGGIAKMESEFQRLEQMKSRYGEFEEIESKLNKLEQMEAELAVFETVKTMFGGIAKILPGLDRLKKTEFEYAVFKQNQLEMPLIDFLQPSSDSLQDLSNHVEHSENSNNQGSTGYSDMVREYEICDMSIAVETPYSDALVTDFIIDEFETNSRSDVQFSSFKDLDGERQRVGNYSFPMSLVSTVNAIIEAHGDVTRNCLLGPSAAETTYVLLCAAIKEMGDLSLKQVTEEIILNWRDAIRDAMRIGFDVEFAWEHLKTIAYGYFGLKARNYRTSLEKRMKKLMDGQKSLRKKLEKKEEEVKAVNAEVEELISPKCKMCLDCADRFLHINVGLFR